MQVKHSFTLLKNGQPATPAAVAAPHLGWSHPLAEVAVAHCRSAGHVARVGGVACGACWELAIRDDERFAVECGLPREVVADPDYVDWVAVRQACAGRRVPLTPVERAEAIRRLYAQGLTRGQVAARLFLGFQDVPAPVVERAERALRDFGVTAREDARRLIGSWAHYRELTERDVRAVLDRFPPADQRPAPTLVLAAPAGMGGAA
jgi:hypothetical protein